jgi:hypothetical protein
MAPLLHLSPAAAARMQELPSVTIRGLGELEAAADAFEAAHVAGGHLLLEPPAGLEPLAAAAGAAQQKPLLHQRGDGTVLVRAAAGRPSAVEQAAPEPAADSGAAQELQLASRGRGGLLCGMQQASSRSSSSSSSSSLGAQPPAASGPSPLGRGGGVSWATSSVGRGSSASPAAAAGAAAATPPPPPRPPALEAARAWLRQAGALARRERVAMLRNPTDVAGRALAFCWLGLLVGLVYFSLGYELPSFRTRASLLEVQLVVPLLLPCCYMSFYAADRRVGAGSGQRAAGVHAA